MELNCLMCIPEYSYYVATFILHLVSAMYVEGLYIPYLYKKWNTEYLWYRISL